MPSLTTVFFQTVGGEDVVTLTMQFQAAGVPADPSNVSCVITDPASTATVHTYLGAVPADITKNSTGNYSLNIPSTVTGLWSYCWIGDPAGGPASDVQAGTWTVGPGTLSTFYTSLEEVKSRLKITDSNDDDILHGCIHAAARAVEKWTGRFFYQSQQTRTYRPYTLYELPIDDLITCTQLAVDYNGTGVFSTVFVQGVDFELQVGEDYFNPTAGGEQHPYTLIRIINISGGQWFPFVWPFSRLDRIQIIGNWGWPSVPYAVTEATRQTASELYKLKDSPFGLSGTSEFGVVRLPKQNPYVQKLLSPYIHPRRRVGI